MIRKNVVLKDTDCVLSSQTRVRQARNYVDYRTITRTATNARRIIPASSETETPPSGHSTRPTGGERNRCSRSLCWKSEPERAPTFPRRDVQTANITDGKWTLTNVHPATRMSVTVYVPPSTASSLFPIPVSNSPSEPSPFPIRRIFGTLFLQMYDNLPRLLLLSDKWNNHFLILAFNPKTILYWLL